MKNKEHLIVPLFGLFFIGLFVPNESFKSLSYLGIAYFFVTSVKAETFSFKNLLDSSTLFLGIFFLLHIVGLTYSENIDEAVRIVVLRLPLLLVPPFLFYSRFLGNHQRKKIEFTYATVCIIAGLIGLGYRLYYIYFINYNTNWLYNDNLVSIFGLQAVYFGIYLCIASIFITKSLLDKEQTKKWLLIPAIALLCIFMFLLASRASLILFFLLNFIVVFYFGFRRNKKIIPVFMGVFAMLLLVVFLVFPTTIKRFKSIANIEFTFDKNPDYYHFGEELDESQWNGLNSRLAMWTAAFQTVGEQLIFGVGTGDKQDELRKTYEKLHFNLGLERNFGTHNQYLEVLLMFGIVGLILFFLVLFIPIFRFLKEQNIISALIIAAFLVAFLTEDFLSRNQGVAIFAFFYAYFASKVND